MSNLKYTQRVTMCTLRVFTSFHESFLYPLAYNSFSRFYLHFACFIIHFLLITLSCSPIRLTVSIEVQQGTMHAHSNPS